MNLQEFKNALNGLQSVEFILPKGNFVPAHFHVTEVGVITRHFIDCGGTERVEKKINFQLWVNVDKEHRLNAEKLLNILAMSEQNLKFDNLEIEVEFQDETIGKYGLEFDDNHFLLTNLSINCLAQDQCGIPKSKPKIRMGSLGLSSCDPKSGCC